MRINLTKKDLVNVIYMQVGFSKQIIESLIEEFFSLIVSLVICIGGIISIIVCLIGYFLVDQVHTLCSTPFLHFSHSRLQIGHLLILFSFRTFFREMALF